jgi:large subunit ribosomal protein L10
VKLEEKKQIVEDLRSRFQKSQLVILTDFKGLDVASVSDLRRKLKAAGVEYKVVKNTLMARASQDTPVAVMADHFKGPGAVAISYQDPVEPAKILSKFADDSKKLEIRAAVLNGALIDVSGVKALAALPPREVLLGQLLAVMAGVPTSVVRVLAGVPRALVTALSALRDQRQAAEAPPAS